MNYIHYIKILVLIIIKFKINKETKVWIVINNKPNKIKKIK